MSKILAPVKSYPSLVKNIQAELQDLDFFIRRRTAEGYWRVGKFIHQHLLENKKRANYGQKLFEDLEKDVSRDKTTLRRAVQFYLAYPISADQRQLSWDHYKRLITVQDKDKRAAFEKMALNRDWTAGRLEDAIRLDRLKVGSPPEKPKSTAAKLNVTRSRLFTYKILEPAYLHQETEEKVVDLGFSNNIEAEIFGVANLKNGEIIESKKTGSKYSFTRSDAKPKELYTYVALVERVVDGDTIWLNIDCGFKVWTRQKVRLRGIDCPELTTKEGIQAKEFVEAQLKETNFVVVKTHSSDKYGRYLADIFYLKDEKEAQVVLAQGVFLNQELLKANLAAGY